MLELPLLTMDYYGVAADLVLASIAVYALRIVWKAGRKDKNVTEKERNNLLERIEELTNKVEELQELRIEEALSREDRQHQVLQQYATKVQELATALSQVQYAVMIALRLDSLKNPPGDAPHAS